VTAGKNQPKETTMATALRTIEAFADGPPLSLDLPDGLPFDQWVRIGRKLCAGQQALNWHIGDWWAFGDHRYGDRAKVAAEGIFGREFGTLANLASVSRTFEPSRRREVVSFTHHVETASLDPSEADALLDRAQRDHLSTRDLRREVQAIKAANDPEAQQQPDQPPTKAPPQLAVRNELTEAYGRYVEAMEALETFRKLTRREADFLAFSLDKLGEAHAERRPVPEDFDIVFVEQGRIACEAWYRASRITVNRWLLQRGKQRLIEERSKFVKHQRNIAADASEQQPATVPPSDPFLSIARMAAEHLRVSRYGGWIVSQCGTGGWRVGTVYRSSEELIAMAERQGFDRQAAVTEAREEGY
jgi:hypothetical protein